MNPLVILSGDLDGLLARETFVTYLYIYIYIYTKITVWCEDEERSIPLKVERK